MGELIYCRTVSLVMITSVKSLMETCLTVINLPFVGFGINYRLMSYSCTCVLSVRVLCGFLCGVCYRSVWLVCVLRYQYTTSLSVPDSLPSLMVSVDTGR